jgi:hypothetical protein
MKYKLSLITLLVMGLVVGFSGSAFGLAGDLTVTATVADAANAIAPGDTAHVVTAFTVTADPLGGNTIATLVASGTSTMAAGEITRVALYNDVTGSGIFDFNATKNMEAPPVDVATFAGGGPITFNIADVVLGASGTAKYLLVIDVRTALVDLHAIDASINLTAVGAGVLTPYAGGTPDPVNITATHLRFLATAFNAVTGAANAEMIAATVPNFLSAVDDYGNLATTFAEGVSFDMVSYTNPTVSFLATATAQANPGGALNVKLGSGAVFMAGGLLASNTAGAVGAMFSLKNTVAGDITIYAQSATSLLEGSYTLRNAAGVALAGVVSTRGVEVYDTNHNGFIDHVTIMLNAPVNVASPGLANNLSYSVAGYATTSTPVLNFDAGGAGIRNAGAYGVTLTVVEKTAYDTNAKPDVTYNASVAALNGASGGTMGNIVSAGAIEVDKARPILISTKTDDANANGIIDGIRLIFSEPVSNLSANSAQVVPAGPVGAYSTALSSKLQGGLIDTPISFTGGVSGLPSNDVVITVNETIPNSGLLPVLLYNENSGFSIRDASTDATGSFSPNYMVTSFNSFAANPAKQINVKDGVSPIITGVVTGDLDVDGTIDQLVVTFSETMNPVNAYSFSGLTGHVSIPTFGVNGSYTATAGVVTGNIITYTITETGAGVYDTEAKPTIYYNPAVGNLRDFNGFELADYGPSGRTVNPAYLIDGAAPVIVAVTTGDDLTDTNYAGGTAFEAAGSNGRLDNVVFTFSEQVKTAAYATTPNATNLDAAINQFALSHEDGTAPATVGALTHLTSAAVDGSAPTWDDTAVSAGDTRTRIKVFFREVSFANLVASGANLARNNGDTGALPQYAYALGAVADQFLDMNDVSLVPVALTAAKTVDGAKPFITDGLIYPGTTFANVITFDDSMAVAASDSYNGDGYIDSFKMFFSENVKWPTANVGSGTASAFTVANAAGFSTISLDKGVDANLDGVIDANDVNFVNDNVIVYGTSSKVNERWDTGLTPTVAFNAGVVVNDTAGNAMAAFGAKASYDGAPPVIVRATGSVQDITVLVQFSETVYSAGAVLGLAGLAGNAVFVYDDFNGWGAKNVTTALVTTINSSSVRINVDSTLTLSDVTSDMIHIQGLAASGVYDNANAGTSFAAPNIAMNSVAGVGLMITINDVIAPWITSAFTIDANGNGYIDHIRFTFSENIKDASLFGYNGINTLSMDDSAKWMVSGYTGTVRWNFFENTVLGQAAAFAAGEPIFTDNFANDNVLYLTLEENNVPVSASGVGSTDFLPTVTWNDVDLSDFKPNLLNTASTDPTATNGVVVDAVGPVMMSAATTSTKTLDVLFSEDIILSTVTKGTYNWTLGGFGQTPELGNGWEQYTVNITKPAAGVSRLEVIPDKSWTEPTTGTLVNWASVRDNLLNWGATSGAVSYGAARYMSTATTWFSATVVANVGITVGIPGTGGAGAVTKATLNKVATNLDINNKNVNRVYFAGAAGASDVIDVKLVDAAGTATSAVEVTANATTGAFSGQIDASPLANGVVTLWAGKNVASVVTWQQFADYQKETIAIGAPADLAVTDVPADQGGFVDVAFTKSANDGSSNPSDFYVVDYYVLQGKKGDDWFTVATFNVDGNTDATYRASGVWVGMEEMTEFRLNAHSMLPVAKAAADAADAMSSAYVTATGSAIDNIVPGPFVAFNADGTAGTGVAITWTAPADQGLFNAKWNLYGVDTYDVYRKVLGSTDDYTLIGSNLPSSAVFPNYTFTDNVANGPTIYDYIVKAVDGSQVTTSITVKGMASNGADFNGDGVVSLGDLVLLGSEWALTSTSANYVINYDLNKDGSVGLGDLVILGSKWNTAGKVAAKSAPMPGVALDLTANRNEATNMMFVNVNAKDVTGINGVAFSLKYDTNLYEFAKDSVAGLGTISLANENTAGVIDIASVYVNEQFGGTITLGFKAKGRTSDMNVTMTNTEVSLNGTIGSVNDLKVVLKAIPKVFALSQNFPNPFNPTTTIEYQIPTAGNVSLVIYNLAGQKVRTLVNETKAPSYYKVIWDGRNESGSTVATGTYFYKLVSGNYSKIVKMTLIK